MDSAVSPAPDSSSVVAAAGLPVPQRAWWVDVPQRYLLLAVADAYVAAADPDMAALMEVPGTYVFARDGSAVHARFFAPALGVPEDPATGSAAVALAAMLAAEGEPVGSLDVAQGAELGMPCRIKVAWKGRRVRLAGSVVRDETRVLET